MAFIVRIELHDAKYNEYNVLHQEMERRGFTRTIRGSDGATYHLPTAEYEYAKTATGEQVRELAAAAAAVTRKTYAVLVTKQDGCWWNGLPKVAASNPYASV